MLLSEPFNKNRTSKLNARSVSNRATLIHDLNVDVKSDLACISEMWLGQEVGGIPLFKICPVGFCMWYQLRPHDRNSEVAVVIQDSWETSRALLLRYLAMRPYLLI